MEVLGPRVDIELKELRIHVTNRPCNEQLISACVDQMGSAQKFAKVAKGLATLPQGQGEGESLAARPKYGASLVHGKT